MAMENHTESLPPHVLVFPLPMQGHVNSMIKLAELLCLSGLHATLLVSDHNYTRLQRHANLKTLFDRYPGFGIKSMTDGLPDDHPRTGVRTMDIVMNLKAMGKKLFTDLMVSTDRLSSAGNRRPVTCLIMDGVLGFAAEVADEMGFPFMYFRTVGACSFWANFCIPRVIEADEVPLKGKGCTDINEYKRRPDMDLPVTSIPGMEGILRRRDLPGFFRVEEVDDPGFQTISSETRKSTRARALISNTFEDLEGPILNQIRNHCPILFSVGPLHLHLETRLKSEKNPSSSKSSGTFWEEDRSCMTWLDQQPSKSVIYVSFGSVTMISKAEVMEFWHGLIDSGVRFLWVMRPDSITDGEKDIPEDVEKGTKDRGFMVSWAPQLEVLAHPAVGGFLTHSGWNSTLEGVAAGKPMICWPYFADQMINSRFVSEVWKIGLDTKDTCDRVIIAKRVKDLMVERKDEFQKRSEEMAKKAELAVNEGGTSYNNLNGLIEFIMSL